MQLFIDTTSKMHLGIIKDDSFIYWEDFLDHLASSKIQRKIYDAFSSLNADIQDIDALITMAGPGSYTGVRVAKGIADCLSYLKISHYSLYHYEIPKMIGIDSGVWFSYAFKNEYFTYHWNNIGAYSKLIPKEEFIPKDDMFTTSDSQFRDTLLLLKDNIKEIKRILIEDHICREPIYYRQVEDEFKK